MLTRGIPRYIHQQLRAVLRHGSEHEYVLLHGASDAVTRLPEDVRAAPGVTLRVFPGGGLSPPEQTLRATEELEAWLVRERIDVFHTPAPWLQMATVFPRIDACPVVTTAYDFIPTLFHELLAGPLREGWRLAVEQMRCSTRLIAISYATARDATVYAHVPPDRIDVACPHADPWFRPLPPDVLETTLARLRRRLDILGRFVMTVSYAGFRHKNLDTLLEAYRRLPASLRQTLPLVVVGTQQAAPGALGDICWRLGITADVRVTDVVSDDEIVALYNAATLVVCPSRYEGFGMPIVEAMQCGTPVVTTTASSMPEVSGDAAWLVHPEDASAFADAIATLAGDEARRRALREAGLERAKRFTSDALGLATLASYRRAAASGGGTSSDDVIPHRPRIALRMPNPVLAADRARTAIETADALRDTASVDLYVTGDGALDVELLQRFRIRDAGAFDRVHGGRPYDGVLTASAESDGWTVTTSSGERTLTAGTLLPGVADPLGPQPRLQREQARAILGVSTTSYVLAWPEHDVTPSELRTGLLAVADVCRACPDTWLFVPCDPRTGRVPDAIAEQAAALAIRERVRAQLPAAHDASPATHAATADTYLAAADVVLAIAGTRDVVPPQPVMRACAAGKPVVVDEHDAWAWLPADACVKVPTTAFGVALSHVLVDLSHDLARREALDAAARAAYLARWTLDHLGERWRRELALGGDEAVPAGDAATVSAAQPDVAPLGFNRVCNIEDFAHPDLVAEMHEVLPHKVRHFGAGFPRGVEHCKDWEVAMATRTLRHFGAIRPDASILGVAAGMESTIFYLSKRVREVMVVDRYAQPGAWGLNSPLWMLVSPELGAVGDCDPERLVVQHMDARRLRFPNDRFDGIFSSSSIEHFGGAMDVAYAAYEMGRVLKPGGILSLSTTLTAASATGRLLGEAGNCFLFDPGHLQRFIVEASGLELVDAFVTDTTPATHAARRSVEQSLTEWARRAAAHGLKGLQEESAHWEVPNVSLEWDGVTFHSVHLALRKPATGWGVANAWARPTADVEVRVRQDYARLVEDSGAWMPPSPDVLVPVDRPEIHERRAAQATRALIRQHAGALGSQLDGLRAEIERLTPAPPQAGQRAQRAGAHPETWQPIPIRVPGIPDYVVFVDAGDRRDIIVDAYLKGHGGQLNTDVLTLIRACLRPGDPVIDAGAHLGSVTLPLAALGHPVLAVEASSRNVALLRASCACNGFRDVTVVHAAAADAEGTLGFYADGAWGWVAPPGEPVSEVVPAVRLDDLVHALGWPRVGAVKIDVEGAELAVVSGLARQLSRPDGPPVYYESNTHTHQHAGTSVGQVVAALERYGYRSYAVGPRRLTRVRPDDPQDIEVRDHLAVKGALPVLAGLRIDERGR